MRIVIRLMAADLAGRSRTDAVRQAIKLADVLAEAVDEWVDADKVSIDRAESGDVIVDIQTD